MLKSEQFIFASFFTHCKRNPVYIYSFCTVLSFLFILILKILHASQTTEHASVSISNTEVVSQLYPDVKKITRVIRMLAETELFNTGLNET